MRAAPGALTASTPCPICWLEKTLRSGQGTGVCIRSPVGWNWKRGAAEHLADFVRPHIQEQNLPDFPVHVLFHWMRPHSNHRQCDAQEGKEKTKAADGAGEEAVNVSSPRALRMTSWTLQRRTASKQNEKEQERRETDDKRRAGAFRFKTMIFPPCTEAW